MWSAISPQREDLEERCDRLLQAYEADVARLQATQLPPYWDGFCGLVKVQDEDWVRPESSPQNTAAAGAHVQQQQQQPRPAAQLPPPQPFRRHVRGGNGGGAHTPPSGISPRSSPSVSPLRPAPGLAPREQQSAAALAEQAAVLLAQRGRLQEAESLLLTALRRCPITSTQLAGRICDLLIEAEREAQVTPTHSRQASEADAAVAAFDAGAAAGGGRGGEGGGGSVASLFRQATQALAKGEERRALSLLQAALADCPPERHELRRRIELHVELVRCKRQPG